MSHFLHPKTNHYQENPTLAKVEPFGKQKFTLTVGDNINSETIKCSSIIE